MGERFAVIDTETTWGDDVMSIGVIVSDDDTFDMVHARYHVILPYANHDAMYSDVLYIGGLCPDMKAPRREVMEDIVDFLDNHGVSRIFAYNANFDCSRLPELVKYRWYDIMRLAAYRQYNDCIPEDADCFKTGKLKRGYGVEDIYRMLSKDYQYFETHNALFDAVDELGIMKMLGHGLDDYEIARVGEKKG